MRSPVRRGSRSWLLMYKCVERANLTALADTACPAPSSTWPNLFTFILAGSPPGALLFDAPLSVGVCLLCIIILYYFFQFCFGFFFSSSCPLYRGLGDSDPPVSHLCVIVPTSVLVCVFKAASSSLMCQAVFCGGFNPLCAVLCIWWIDYSPVFLCLLTWISFSTYWYKL